MLAVQEAEESASDLARYHLHLYAEADPNRTILSPLLRGLGIGWKYRYCPDHPEWRANGFHTEGFRLVIINSALPTDERRWWIAHEIGHIMMEHPEGRDEGREVAANLYAGELLLPERRIRGQVSMVGNHPSIIGSLNVTPICWTRARLIQLGLAQSCRPTFGEWTVSTEG